MLAQIKTTEESTYTYSQWKIIGSRKNQSRKKTMIYFIKQKVFGLVMSTIGIVAPFILEGDATFSLIALPLGIYLIFTKQRVMTF